MTYVIDDESGYEVDLREHRFDPSVIFGVPGDWCGFVWYEDHWHRFDDAWHIFTSDGEVSTERFEAMLEGLPPLPDPWEGILRRALAKARNEARLLADGQGSAGQQS